MSRNTRLLILAILILDLLIALTAFGLKMGVLGAPPGLGVRVGPIPPQALFALSFIPVWMSVGWAILEWQVARRSLRPAADHRRIVIGGFVATALFCLLVQLVFADALTTGWAPGGLLFLRLTTAFVGGLLAVQGNFLAKTNPPTGEKAPTPARWTRHVLRVGWVMALVGLALVVCSVVLPISSLHWAMLGGVTLIITNNLLNRRTLRGPAHGLR